MSKIKIDVDGTAGIAEIDGVRYEIVWVNSGNVVPLDSGGFAILLGARATEITPDEARVRVLSEIAENSAYHLVGYEDE